jgi:hypothetical protein
MKFRKLALQFFCCITLAFPVTSMAQAQQTLSFSGLQYGNPGTFNGLMNELNIQAGGAVIGSFDFVVTPSQDSYQSDPMRAFYSNSVNGFVFNNEKSTVDGIAYSSIAVHAQYGMVQFYANSIHDGFSDVFSINITSKNGAFMSDDISFSDLTPSNTTGTSDWNFQRYNFQTGGLVQYHGSVTNFNFTSSLSPVPEPQTYGMLLAGLSLLSTSLRRKKKNN